MAALPADLTEALRRLELAAVRLHAAEAQLWTAAGILPVASRASLQADLLAEHERAARQVIRIQHLEKRLSEALGEQAWRESGLGASDDIGALNQRIFHLEQQVTDVRLQLDERGDELAANRELMLRANTNV